MLHTILCFRRPKPSAYIGGVVTLCDEYVANKEIFNVYEIDVENYNYSMPSIKLPLGKFTSKIENVAYGYRQAKALKHYLREHPETVVHIHTSRKALFFKDVLLAKYVYRKAKKVLMTIHVGDINTVFHNNYTKRFLINLMNKYIDTTIFLSKKMNQQFIDSGLKVEHSTVLYNFYNIPTISLESKPKNLIPRLIYLGSINKEKGIIELLSALFQVKYKVHLDLCGTIIEESIKDSFEELLYRLGDKVTYHGYVDKTKKSQLLSSADVLVLPSYREGLPISILEAMANSCAVVTTPVGAIPEILTEENAIFVEPKNIDQLQCALEQVIENENFRLRMQQNPLMKSKDFDKSVHIKRLCQLYH